MAFPVWRRATGIELVAGNRQQPAPPADVCVRELFLIDDYDESHGDRPKGRLSWRPFHF
jgi:hypothetical protein